MITLAAIPVYADVADSAFAVDQPLKASTLVQLAHNAKFAAVRRETFVGVYTHGQTVAAPKSLIDGYQYGYSEITFWWSRVFSYDAATQKPTGAGCIFSWADSVSAAGAVSVATNYYIDGKAESETNDGEICVVMMCQRSIGTTFAAIPTWADVLDADLAGGEAASAADLAQLNHNIRYAAVRREFFVQTLIHGQTVTAPTSPVDAYVYQLSELQFLPSMISSVRPGSGGNTLGPGTVRQFGCCVGGMPNVTTPATAGQVSAFVNYYVNGGAETFTNDGTVLVLIVGTREKGNRPIAPGVRVQPPPANSNSFGVAAIPAASTIDGFPIKGVGDAQVLDLGKEIHDAVDGTFARTSPIQRDGGGRAWTGLNSSGQLVTGTPATTVANIDAAAARSLAALNADNQLVVGTPAYPALTQLEDAISGALTGLDPTTGAVKVTVPLAQTDPSVVTSAITGTQRNLAPDSDVKCGTAFWTNVGGAAVAIVQARTGSNAWKLTLNANAVGVRVPTALLPNTTYTVSCVIDGSAMTAGYIYVNVGIPDVSVWGEIDANAPPTRRSVTFTTPSSVTGQYLQVGQFDGSGNPAGTGYAYNFQIEPGSVMTAYRPNFGDDTTGYLKAGSAAVDLASNIHLGRNLANLSDDVASGRVLRTRYSFGSPSAGWYMLGTWTNSASGAFGKTLHINLAGGPGFNTNALQQETGEIVIRSSNTASGAPNISGATYRTYGNGSGLAGVKVVAHGGSTSQANNVWDVWVLVSVNYTATVEIGCDPGDSFAWSGTAGSDPGAASTTVVLATGAAVLDAASALHPTLGISGKSLPIGDVHDRVNSGLDSSGNLQTGTGGATPTSVATIEAAAARAIAALNSSNQLTTGTVNKTIADIEAATTKAIAAINASNQLNDAAVTASNVTQHTGSIDVLATTNAPAQAGADVTKNHVTVVLSSGVTTDPAVYGATGGQSFVPANAELIPEMHITVTADSTASVFSFAFSTVVLPGAIPGGESVGAWIFVDGSVDPNIPPYIVEITPNGPALNMAISGAVSGLSAGSHTIEVRGMANTDYPEPTYQGVYRQILAQQIT